ncbi:hypothetical protein ACFXTO_038963 [Malus domestica]
MTMDCSGGSPKHHYLESKKKRLTWIFGVSALCIVCYMIGAWQTISAPVNQSELYQRVSCDETLSQSRNKTSSSMSSSSLHLDFEGHHQSDINKTKAVQKFPPCDMSYSEYTPCQDPTRGDKFNRNMWKNRESIALPKKNNFFALFLLRQSIRSLSSGLGVVILLGMTTFPIENSALRKLARMDSSHG